MSVEDRPKSKMACLILLVVTMMMTHECHGYATNKTEYVTEYRAGQYSIDDLLYGHFPHQISDDLDMDLCKAGDDFFYIYLILIFLRNFLMVEE